MKNDAIKIFEQYISKFDLNNEKIRWKYLHSYRVASLMEWLAKKLKLSKNDVIVAYILGLFHDIGRFPQLDKFDSYNDLNIDHGDLGYKILKEEGLLDKILDKKALEDVASKDTGEVPMHIRNAPAKGMENLGYHQGYLYPHDFPGHYVEQQYLPDKMVGTKYYVKDENCE